MFKAISKLQNKPRVFISEKASKRNVGQHAPEINTIYYRDGDAFASGGDLEVFIHVTQMSQAQKLANKGWFVVAGWQNSIPGESGHMVVIVSETEQAGWGGKVPMTMDTGAGIRSESQKLSYSFGKDKKRWCQIF